MKLWLLKNKELDHLNWESWFDKAFGFVIRAETEDQARKIAQENGGDEVRSRLFPNGVTGETVVCNNAWLSSEYSTCEELTSKGECGMILIDFHAA